MNGSDSSGTTWVTSSEILKMTGISRATLNNYIKYAIIPAPLVKRPDDPDIRARKIGYFPKIVLERIATIKRMKEEGKSMEDIVKSLSENSSEQQRNISAASDSLNLSINDIRSPAYLVNNKFEIEWINKEAEEKIFYQNISMLKDSTERNVFKLLSGLELLKDNHKDKDAEFVKYFMKFYKNTSESNNLSKLFDGISEKEVHFLRKIYDLVEPLDTNALHAAYVSLCEPEGKTTAYNVYHLIFREGILFIHASVDDLLHGVMELLSKRGRIITELMKQRMPTLASFCVLMADLQDSSRICAELPPEEYFELIRDVWKCMDGIFQKYYGTYGKHVGDGMVYYFLKEKDENYIMNSICCAVELREKMKKLNMEWKMRKGWFNDLYLNIGINEGQEFFGSIPSSPNIEFTALGDSVNYAGRLSDLARYGAIWTTKNLINHLDTVARRKVHFGIRRRDNEREVFIDNMFSRVMDMLRQDDPRYSKFMDIATLAVTEIVTASQAEPAFSK
jgi:adenylate cyclase